MMYIMNFIAFILCMSLAVFNGIEGKSALAALEVLMALANLPFAIKWLKSFI